MQLTPKSFFRAIASVFCLRKRSRVEKDIVRDDTVPTSESADHAEQHVDQVQEKPLTMYRTISILCLDKIVARIETGRDFKKVVVLNDFCLHILFGVDKVTLDPLPFPTQLYFLRQLSLHERIAYQRLVCDANEKLLKDLPKKVPYHMVNRPFRY